MEWGWERTYAERLGWLCAATAPVPVAAPRLLALNEPLALELGLDPQWLASDDGVAVLSGSVPPSGTTVVSQAYSGHQFGHFVPMLGDGRVHLLGEVIDGQGRRRDIALKGSGRTPFSRGGDGRAAVGPVLREYLVSEAMHAMGIPTTRSLAAVATGESVHRDGVALPGAVLTRVASSHLRVGTAELVRTQASEAQLAQFVEYVRARHYPDVPPGDPMALLDSVIDAQARLVAAWMGVGFVHGVMNTDNTSLAGETIDYGPCAFLEAHDPDVWFSSIDAGGRYRYGAQPQIAAWNLARLAECLLPLVPGDHGAAVAQATGLVAGFEARYRAAHLRLMGAKLGLPGPADPDVVDELLTLMALERLDHTLTFRGLARVLRGQADAVRGEVVDVSRYDAWEARWRNAIQDPTAAAEAMDAVNPLVIPRNHLVEEALTAALADDLGPFEHLLAAVREPFRGPGDARYTAAGDEEFTRGYRTFCGT